MTLSDRGRFRGRMVPSWSLRPLHDRPGSADNAHLAVVAACEGEAVLVTSWIDTHLAELEKMLGFGVVSMSWTASDIAAVGHLAEGTLQLQAVGAPVWVLAATRVRLQRGAVTAAIAGAVAAAGRSLVRVVLDETAN